MDTEQIILNSLSGADYTQILIPTQIYGHLRQITMCLVDNRDRLIINYLKINLYII